MAGNSFGERFRVTTFGESHGAALGVVIDGCPAGVIFDHEILRHELARRRPGRHGSARSVVSDREEIDSPEVLSGVFQGRTLGTPIAIIVRNVDARSADYSEIAKEPRPGHADDVWKGKFGHSDHRGGGRSSGRETVARVMAGAVAKMALLQVAPKMKVVGFARQIGPIELSAMEVLAVAQILGGQGSVDDFVARLPHPAKSAQVDELLQRAKADGRSYGGVAEIWIEAPPPYLGQPVFHKLKADLACAFMGVGATSAFELGDGFDASHAEGSAFHRRQSTNEAQGPYGGIRGGIATGERIMARVGFKPTATVLDTARRGRHDPCIVPRAIPVLEAMANIVLLDHLMWSRSDRIEHDEAGG